MFIFNKNISFLQPRSVLSAVRPLPPPPALCPSLLCFCDYPLLPHLESDGTVQPGLTSAAWTVPLWGFSRTGRRGVPEQKRKHCVVRQSTSFFSLPPFYLDLVQDKPSVQDETPDSVSVCRCAPCICTRMSNVVQREKKELKKKRWCRVLLCCCYLLYARTHSHRHTHNCYSAPQCFPAPSNQHRPAVPQWAEPRWSQPVSVSVCIWILYFIISLQTASSLIILLTIILRMVSVS